MIKIIYLYLINNIISSCTKKIEISSIKDSLKTVITGPSDATLFGASMDIGYYKWPAIIIGSPDSITKTKDSNLAGQVYVIKDLDLGSKLNVKDYPTFYSGNDGQNDIDALGYDVSFVDFNCDGVVDAVFSDNTWDGDSNTQNGKVYVVYGPLSRFESMSVNKLNSGNSVSFEGAGDSYTGTSVNYIGNFFGGKCPLLAIGSNTEDSNSLTDNGRIYALKGYSSKFKNKKTLMSSDMTNEYGLIIDGMEADQQLSNPTNIYDVNNDEIDDVLMTSRNKSKAYVIFGSNELNKFQSFDLGSLNGLNGFEITYPTLSANQLILTETYGYLDDDKFSDIVVANDNEIYIVFGKSSFTSPIDYSLLTEGEAITITLKTGDTIQSIANVGDVNGDKVDDILVTVLDSVYIIFGGNYLKTRDVNQIEDLILGCYASEITNGNKTMPIASKKNYDIDYDFRDDIVLSYLSESKVYIISGAVIDSGKLVCHQDYYLNNNNKCIYKMYRLYWVIYSIVFVVLGILLIYLEYITYFRDFVEIKVDTKEEYNLKDHDANNETV